MSGSSPAAQRSDRARVACPGSAGQAAIELVALLPLLVLVGALVWQLALAGHATWAAGVAAGAASRAHALGHDAEAAARRRLPDELRSGVRVRPAGAGAVHVSVRIPVLVRGLSLGSAGATAAFEDQRG